MNRDLRRIGIETDCIYYPCVVLGCIYHRRLASAIHGRDALFLGGDGCSLLTRSRSYISVSLPIILSLAFFPLGNENSSPLIHHLLSSLRVNLICLLIFLCDTESLLIRFQLDLS